MAILLDDERQEEINENEELTSFEEAEQPEQTQEEPEQPEQDDLPDKYRGKTPAEIAKMHQEAEKLLGRQSSEVGELRKIVDDFVKAQLEAKTAPEQSTEDDTEVDWYLEPEKAVAKAIENHPKLKQAEQLTQQMQQAKAIQALKAEHPDYMDIVQDEGFKQWVGASKIRTQLLQQADQQYDIDAANELFNTWKERKQIVTQAADQERTQRKQQVKNASTGAVAGSGEAPARKVYRRADIIKLMQTDPDRYMALSDEISRAYAEGRVK